jgi:hypothetical protein
MVGDTSQVAASEEAVILAAKALVDQTIATGEPEGAEAAAVALVQLDCYGRPTATVTLKSDQLFPPVAGTAGHEKGVWALTWHPSHREDKSKNGSQDDTVMLADTPHHAWIRPIVAALKRRNAKSPPDTPLFRISYRKYREHLQKGFTKAKVPKYNPHQLRHTGPSVDAMLRLRTDLAIQTRGTWKAAASIMRYKKEGRYLREVSRLTKDQLADAVNAKRFLEARLPDILAPTRSSKSQVPMAVKRTSAAVIEVHTHVPMVWKSRRLK